MHLLIHTGAFWGHGDEASTTLSVHARGFTPHIQCQIDFLRQSGQKSKQGRCKARTIAVGGAPSGAAVLAFVLVCYF